RASEEWSDDTWKPVVQREAGPRYAYKGDEPVGPGNSERSRLLFNAPQQPLADFHQSLSELAVKPLSVPLVFRPLSHFGVEIDRDRRRAERVVFDGGVIKPLV